MPATRRSLVVLALLITWHAVGPGVAPANEFPADTNTIESLSPEQARRLVTEFPGVRVVVERKGRPQGMLAQCLPLNGLKSVDGDLAEALAGYRKGPLFLDGLTMLSVEAAKALARHRGVLSLSGLTTLSADAAKAIAAAEHWTGYLPCVTTLDSPDSVVIAQALATRHGPLSLPNLKNSLARRCLPCSRRSTSRFRG